MRKEYIELLVEYLKNDNKLSFNELVDFLKKKIDNKVFENPAFLSDLYIELTLDNRFFLYFDKKWGLREDMSEELLKKSNNSFTYTSDDDYYDGTTISVSDVRKSAFNNNLTLSTTTTETDYYTYSNKKRNKHKIDITSRIKDNLGQLNNSKKKNVSQELGVTEDIDWNSIENDWKENN